ncbi:MAG: hypothetical protein ACT4QE_09570 [Anaerolineales bacterium]
MSDLNFYENPEDIPVSVPRAEMRFENVSVQPYPDGRRVKLVFTFPPFLERPSVEAWVTNADGITVATTMLIEAMEQDFDFTLHLRGPEPHGEHTLHLTLFYLHSDDRPDDKLIVDERTVTFTIAPENPA